MTLQMICIPKTFMVNAHRNISYTLFFSHTDELVWLLQKFCDFNIFASSSFCMCTKYIKATSAPYKTTLTRTHTHTNAHKLILTRTQNPQRDTNTYRNNNNELCVKNEYMMQSSFRLFFSFSILIKAFVVACDDMVGKSAEHSMRSKFTCGLN